MPRFSREPFNRMLSLRVTEEQDRLLGELVERLEIGGGKAELLRRALDYWLEHAPEVKKARDQRAGR